ncbi:MAG: hypothetical protein Q8T04_06495, partial [Bacteroidota bacterium]|nr:hypothetical protein [Bacteroidota bacterium]
MKQLLLISIFLLPFLCLAQPKPAKIDILESIIPANIKINGYLGEKIDFCIGERIKKQVVQHLIDPFKTRNETRMWQTEFWGKW